MFHTHARIGSSFARVANNYYSLMKQLLATVFKCRIDVVTANEKRCSKIARRRGRLVQADAGTPGGKKET